MEPSRINFRIILLLQVTRKMVFLKNSLITWLKHLFALSSHNPLNVMRANIPVTTDYRSQNVREIFELQDHPSLCGQVSPHRSACPLNHTLEYLAIVVSATSNRFKCTGNLRTARPPVLVRASFATPKCVSAQPHSRISRNCRFGDIQNLAFNIHFTGRSTHNSCFHHGTNTRHETARIGKEEGSSRTLTVLKEV